MRENEWLESESESEETEVKEEKKTRNISLLSLGASSSCPVPDSSNSYQSLPLDRPIHRVRPEAARESEGNRGETMRTRAASPMMLVAIASALSIFFFSSFVSGTSPGGAFMPFVFGGVHTPKGNSFRLERERVEERERDRKRSSSCLNLFSLSTPFLLKKTNREIPGLPRGGHRAALRRRGLLDP